MAEKDPFTKVYDAIESLFKGQPTFSYVSWNSSADPEPEVAVKVPEIQVRPSGMQAQLGIDSASTDVQLNFQVLLNSGDQRIGQFAFPLNFWLVGIAYRLKYVTLESLTYNNRNYVLTTEVSNTTMGLSNATENRGIRGWTSIMDITVSMSFSKQDFGL